jgi:hypothetical protein
MMNYCGLVRRCCCRIRLAEASCVLSIEYSSYQRVLVSRYDAPQNTVSSGRWFPFRTLCLHVIGTTTYWARIEMKVDSIER